jgi:hypothetical protein
MCKQGCKTVPAAWVRRHPDGALTAEFLEHDVIEPVRKESGAWVPLFLAAPSCECKRGEAAVAFNSHDQGVIADLEAIAANRNNGFWPQALAISALRLIRASATEPQEPKSSSGSCSAPTGSPADAPVAWLNAKYKVSFLHSANIKHSPAYLDGELVPLYASHAPADVQKDALTALQRIADLDPAIDSSDGFNEWGEAECFSKAQGFARTAIAAEEAKKAQP